MKAERKLLGAKKLAASKIQKTMKQIKLIKTKRKNN
jgi:hypothetical protein